MKDPASTIRKAFYECIKGVLASSGFDEVGVFDNILLAGENTPRVVLHNQTYIEEFTKDSFGGVASIDADITDSYKIGTGGSKRIDDISDIITQAVIPEKGGNGLTIPNQTFKIIRVGCDVIPFGGITQPVAEKYLIRKILRFKIFIQQL